MRTRRPSRFQRSAAPRAAALPASSPSARTITSRTSCGRSRASRPEVESAAHAGCPVACIAAREVSMPSPTISTSPAAASRTAPPRHGPSIIFCGSTGALPDPSWARKVRWIARWRIVNTARHQRHHCWPDAARRVLQTGMEAQRGRRRAMKAARGEISLDQRAISRLSRLPDGERGSRCAWPSRSGWLVAVGSARSAYGCGPFSATDHATAEQRLPAPGRSPRGSGPEPCRPRQPDRKARLTVVMSRTARHPAAARPCDHRGPWRSSQRS